MQKIKDYKKWLETECPLNEVRYLDHENKKGAYIPIGIIEQNLDEFDNWNTSDFKCVLQRVDKTWIASGSVRLTVRHEVDEISRNGAVSFPIMSKADNDDYEGTVLSLAIANAAKKLGKRFGRHLNGRLNMGEQIPTIDLQAQRDLDKAIDTVNESVSEEQIKNLFDNVYPQYQKSREFVIAVSNAKHLLKIKNSKDDTKQLSDSREG